MVKTNKEYKRFGGSRRFSFVPGRFSLWLGEDHMVQVCRYAYTEEYRRFYYQDIEAVILRRTNGYWIRAIILGVLWLGMLAVAFTGEVPVRIMGFMGLAAVTVFVVVNFWRGRTCACHVKTAVQTEQLRSITRLVQAENLIARLKFKLPQ